ncbi:sugar transferase [Caenimonas sedimenti]|uniref:Sugar transferase n=2 Tax=Caenimonas sedimenti TaxID=2596921 RepID=A0A562ZVZ1_9BURK|nr:sugar transferase [Caenimonas sedimenti]
MYRVDSDDRLIETPPQAIARDVHVRSIGASGVGRVLKRLLDITGAALFLVLGMPLYLLVALGVKLSSPGPVHYWQYRVGIGGRRFAFIKFRSMVMDGDEVLNSFLDSDSAARAKWETHQKLERDPRITRFGSFIRRTSLDELPQFWNVLLGDMSLVGPRPCMADQDKYYGEHWTTYCTMRPGITGLWQVSGRNTLTYAERVRMDVRYVQEWSLWLDLCILLKTVKVVLTGHGAH